MDRKVRKRSIRTVLYFLIGGFVGFSARFTLSQAEETVYLSPVEVAAGNEGETLYVAQFGARAIAFVSLAEQKVEAEIELPKRPRGLALSPDGSLLYVTGSGAEGKVYVVDVRKREVCRSFPAGHTPVSPVLGKDGKTLYVCNRFDGDVSYFDLKAGKEIARIPAGREPVASAITPDGKTLYVANHLPAGASSGAYSGSVVTVIDTKSKKRVGSIELPNGSTGLKDICVSPGGAHAYVTHILSRYQLPTTQLDRGWMNTNALTVIDAAKRKYLNTVLLDDVDLGAANPWGVACTRGGEFICVAHSGTHEISVIDRKALHERLDKAHGGGKATEVSDSPEDVPNDLAFLAGIRRRVKLKGNGPRGIAVFGDRACAAEYFSGSLGVVDVKSGNPRNAKSIPLGPSRKLTVRRRGELLFNDATLCFQNWQSCASCHPEGRNDGLNWDLLNDGIGNPKNTKSLLFAHETPPAMVTAARDTAEMAVRAGIKHILFAARPKGEAEALDAYIKSLRPVPSPHLSHGKLSEAARRGKKVFKRAGCAKCHSGKYFTDGRSADVGTGEGRHLGEAFDTPHLREVWRTAPYLYDGRAEGLKEVLTKYNPADKHGETSKLTGKEIEDLVQYILSL